MAAHAEVSMQVPAVPPTEHDGAEAAGVQHSMFAAPAQKPGVEV